MAKPDYDLLVQSVENDFKLAEDALKGAKDAAAAIEKTTDEETRKALEGLKNKFLAISQDFHEHGRDSSFWPVIYSLIYLRE
jgi:hypothetical protein